MTVIKKKGYVALVSQILMNRKVLPETGLMYPPSVLRFGCTRLPTPRCSLGPHTILSRAESTGASRSLGALQYLVRTIKQELWIE